MNIYSILISINLLVHQGCTLYHTWCDPNDIAASNHAKNFWQSMEIKDSRYCPTISGDGMDKDKFTIMLDTQDHFSDGSTCVRCGK